ncbi:MAG: SdrD B-like domain-containing protein, partial [Bacteroidota bacterium]
YSGNVVDALSESSLLYQRRVTVVTAASDSVPTYFERVALPDGSTGYRLGFSYHFLQCFGDPRADTDDDGLTSFEEAYTWVRTQDPAFTFGDNIFSTTAPQFFSHRPLEVQKVVAESFVEAGDTFTYVITLTNPNPATTARSITLFDVLPFRTRYRNVTTSQGQCRVSGDSISTVDCEVGDIAPGATVEIRIEADAAQPGDATNTVRVGDLSGIAELVIAEPPVFELCGQKFIDTNGNGLRDPGEPGGDGFVIELVSEDGVVNATTTTAAEDTNDDGVIDETEERGRFCFTGLERGRYIVREAPRPGWRQTTPTDPGTYTVDLATGTQPRILFGNTPDSTTAQDLSGRKFWDLNGNGVQDPHEPGADGFDFELLDADGQVVATATSARADRNDDGQIDLLTEAGHFQFSNVPDGTYTLREVARAGWMQTAPAAGTYTVTLPAEELPELLFGNKGDPTTSTTVCGFKFFDANQNGVRDATEVGLDGFTIELLDASGAVVAQAVTSSQDLNGDGVIDPLTEQGRYCFPDLPPGTYTLREVVPAGWTQTAPVGGTYTFTVPSLELPDFDFGNYTERERDYGDLPDPCPIAPGPGYPTLRASGGASHVLGAGPFFGVTVDAEADGQPTFFANGDDLVGQADEDGLVDVRATIGGNGALDLSILVTVPPPFFGAFVSGWIDLDDDCQFNNLPFPAGERILNAAPALMGVNVLTTPPGVAQPLGAGPKALRLRISAFGGLPPTGLARDGEVEDYYLDIDGQDYGDAPGAVDPTRPAFPGGYPTTLAQNGARHTIDEGFRLGQYLDADANVEGQYDALEDDLNQQQDDEDGIRLLEGFGTDTHVDAGIHATVQPGTVARLLPLPSTDGRLDAWIDWNRDGDWDDAGEQVFASVDIGPEMDEDDALEVAVPADADLGFTYARFRLSKQGGLAPTGLVFGGEVEDLLLQVVSATNVANEDVDGLPSTFTLHGNYPNPFNPETQIRYDVARAAHVQLAVFNTLGQVVQVLVDEEQAAGTHQATWNGRSEDGAEMASGVYLARLVVIDAQGLRHVQTHALVLLR